MVRCVGRIATCACRSPYSYVFVASSTSPRRYICSRGFESKLGVGDEAFREAGKALENTGMRVFILCVVRIVCQKRLEQVTFSLRKLLLSLDKRMRYPLILVQIHQRSQGTMEGKHMRRREQPLQNKQLGILVLL